MPDMFSDAEWFAVVAHVRQHDLAKQQLENQKYRVFMPMCRKERRHAGKVDVVERPLFDRYMFVGLGMEQPFHPISGTRGVAFVVRGIGGIPSRVSPLALRRVKSRCDAFEDGVVDMRPCARRELVAKWSKDQPVKIERGPFADFMGLFAGANGDMVKLLVDLFGRPTLVAVPIENLAAA